MFDVHGRGSVTNIKCVGFDYFNVFSFLNNKNG